MTLVWLSLVLVASYLIGEKCVQAEPTQMPETATSNYSYWVSTSNKLRAGYPMELTMWTIPGNDPVTVTVSITYETYGENTTVRTLFTSSPKEVPSGVMQTLLIDIPIDIKVKNTGEYGTYKVNIVGQGRTLNFKHTGDLTLLEQTVSVFIATDKAIYRPGETVKFRAFAMEPATLKVIKQPMDIFITDSKGNRVKQIIGVTGTQTLGVVQDSFELAAKTLLGDWKIIVTFMGQTEEKVFTVDYYVLPKFEVVVKPPSIALNTDLVQTITISAKYTFGQPVTGGVVNTRVTLNQPWQIVKSKNEFLRSGKLNSNGEFKLEINKKYLLNLVVKEYKDIVDLTGWTFLIEVNVTEESTKRVQSSSATMQMYNSPMQAMFLSISPENFKAGLAYTGYVEVKKVDGTKFPAGEISKTKAYINVTYEVLKPQDETTTAMPNSSSDDSVDKVPGRPGFWYQPTETRILALDNPVQSIPESGFFAITFNVPGEAISASIQVTFDNPYENNGVYHYISKSESYEGSYLQLIPPMKPPQVGETMPVKVVSTKLVKQLTYQVFSKGILVANSTINSPTAEGSKSFNFDLHISQTMVPAITILVFGISEGNGEVFADALSISIDGLFPQPVTMSFSEKKVEPGQTFDAIIKAEPDSLVFVVARDKSSELAKNGSDITQEMVRDKLAAFETGSYSPAMGYMFICGWPWNFGGNNVAATFQSANVLFFTNALMYTNTNHYYPLMFMDKNGAGNNENAPAPTSSGFLEANRVRKQFIESMIWDYFLIPSDSNGEVRVKVTSPDTITTWVARFFSVNSNSVLSVGSTSAEVTTFRKLFVSLDLPLFIIRNETFCFAYTVLSYYPGTIPVLVRFESSKDYNGAFVNRSGEEAIMSSENKPSIDVYPDVAENEVRSSKFCFIPIKTGQITLKVSALTNIPDLSDAVEQVITVKPEGVARSNIDHSLVNLTSGFWQKEVPLNFPTEIVSDSQSITVSVVANLMGSIFKNIRDLLQKPYGCGEQNMINFGPSVTLLDFFFSTNTMTSEILELAKGYISLGFQTELTYEHTQTGGYSAFGDNDANSSTWLSAFVLSTYSEAAIVDRKHNISLGLDLIPAIIRTAFYLISNQNGDGSFAEYGVVFHVAMQGGSKQDEALTAYVLIALASANEALKDNLTARAEIQKSMARAGDFLASRFDNLVDSYTICIVTDALNKINHPSKNFYFEKMEQIAVIEDGVKFWKQAASKIDPEYPWSPPAPSLDIEASSYGLLTYVTRGTHIPDGLPVLRYLLQKSGPNGGFTSTQDTVIGLQALSGVLAKMYSAGRYSMVLTINYTDDNKQSQSRMIQMSKDTEFLLQTVDIPYKNNAPTSLTLTANTLNGEVGPSTILLDTVLNYNVREKIIANCFELSHVLTSNENGLELTITIKSLSEDATSMSLLIVEIPAGFDPTVPDSDYISQVDPYTDGKLTIYFNSYVIDSKGISVTILMEATSGNLVEAKPRSFTVSSYYDPNCQQTQTYIMASEPLCTAIKDVGICRYMSK